MKLWLAGAALAACLAVQLGAETRADGDLSLLPTPLEPLVFGSDDYGFEVSTKHYEIETGEAYSLLISSRGLQEYAVVSPDFFKSIWLRKVEAGGLEIKAMALTELEFEQEGEAELFFVPIVPGEYRIWARGLEERGAFATINVR